MLDAAHFNHTGSGCLPGLLGIVSDLVEPAAVHGHVAVRPKLLAPNGYLHAATVVALKSNHLGTTLGGHIECTARPVHRGRPLALFRCAQMILYPK